MQPETYIVICLDGGEYQLATRTVFETYEAAARYASAISKSRKARVVSGRFGGLRFGEVRGTEAYWETRHG